MSGHPALVDSLGLLSERAGDVTGLVYTRLFAAYPELEDLFLMDTDGGVRGSMLSQAFECLMDLAEGRARWRRR
jgi:hemoglobin-like flavoprotein